MFAALFWNNQRCHKGPRIIRNSYRFSKKLYHIKSQQSTGFLSCSSVATTAERNDTGDIIRVHWAEDLLSNETNNNFELPDSDDNDTVPNHVAIAENVTCNWNWCWGHRFYGMFTRRRLVFVYRRLGNNLSVVSSMVKRTFKVGVTLAILIWIGESIILIFCRY
jgi:hypothetical protein